MAGPARVVENAAALVAAMIDGILDRGGLGPGDQYVGGLAEVAGLSAGTVRPGGKGGAWAFANLGVAVALAIAFAGWLLGGRRTVRAQEDTTVPETTAEVRAP